MKFILGEKVGMSQIFHEDGRVIPVTIVKAGPCKVTQMKSKAKDGYQSVQIGFGNKKTLNKPLGGHLKGTANFRYLREFRITEEMNLKNGQELKAGVFQPGDIVNVVGISKGHGFQGVVKRYGFHGQKASHGHKDQLRMPGSIGATDPGHVFKGTRMAGHMGDQQVTVKNLEIVKVDSDSNFIYIKGAVPGANSGLLLIQGQGEMKLIEEIPVQTEVIPEAVAETPAEEVKAEETSESTQENN